MFYAYERALKALESSEKSSSCTGRSSKQDQKSPKSQEEEKILVKKHQVWNKRQDLSVIYS